MNHFLEPWNAFGIDHSAQHIICAEDEQQLLNAWQYTTVEGQPVLILGEGSNILFLEDYRDTVIINRIRDTKIHDEPGAWYLHVGAGENWHRLIKYTLQEGIPGLEDLALIPGCVGPSPIQNIGVYNVELQQACTYVDCVKLATDKQVHLTAKECRFSYHDSILKHKYQDRFAIVAVGLHLPKEWQPVLMYDDLARLDLTTVTPQQVFNTVCRMRTIRFPDPKVNGNVGSLFKNSAVSTETTRVLLAQFPTAPNYPQAGGSVKLAAGWLINQCQLRGMQMGGAAVHRQQALAPISGNNAKSEDVVQLAYHVRQKVGEKSNA